MTYRNACLCLFLPSVLCLSFSPAHTQPNTTAPPLENPELSGKYIQAVHQKMARFNRQSEKYTLHALNDLIDEEKTMQRQMAVSDPVRSRQLFAYSIDTLQKLASAITSAHTGLSPTTIRSYFPYTDTLKQCLAYLQHLSGTAGQPPAPADRLASSLRQVDQLEGKFTTIAGIQAFIHQRQQVLTDALQKLPQYAHNLEQLKKTAYYYTAQIEQYKSTLKDPAAVERKMLDLVEQSPAFQKLIQNNGRLAGLFAPRSVLTGITPGVSTTPVTGLPARAMVQQYIKKNMPQAADTTDPLSQIQPKLIAAGTRLHESGGAPGLSGGASDLPGDASRLSGGAPGLGLPISGIPGTGATPVADFTPNSQRTKPFGKRMEWGMDLQFGRAVSYLPTTANIGIKAGYRLNDRLSAGVGVDYLMGMGTGWKDIHFTNQGVGLRSYGKWQIKKGWNIQGGAEFNYLPAINSVVLLHPVPNWQTSALLGISKQYKVSRKISGNFQVLYDFLYRQHLPNTQPVLFRLGYDLK